MNKKLSQEAFEAELIEKHKGTKLYRYKWPGFPRSTYYYHTRKPSWFTRTLGIWTSKRLYAFGESRVCGNSK